MPGRSLEELRAALSGASAREAQHIADLLEDDPRKGAGALRARALRVVEQDRKERERLARLFSLQAHLHEAGVQVVAGVDEVGRGAVAGPVTAGAVVIETGVLIPGLDDSKKLSARRREELDQRIRSLAVAVSVAHVPPDVVDSVGIAEATRRAMDDAVGALGLDVGHVLVDGLDARLSVECTPVVHGDSCCASIAAASVVAKVARDALMVEHASAYPGYGFDKNKGYGTVEHLEAVRTLGPSPLHRRTFLGSILNERLF